MPTKHEYLTSVGIMIPIKIDSLGLSLMLMIDTHAFTYIYKSIGKKPSLPIYLITLSTCKPQHLHSRVDYQFLTPIKVCVSTIHNGSENATYTLLPHIRVTCKVTKSGDQLKLFDGVYHICCCQHLCQLPRK